MLLGLSNDELILAVSIKKKSLQKANNLLLGYDIEMLKGPSVNSQPHISRGVCLCAKSVTDAWKKKNLPFVMPQRVVIPHRRLSKVSDNTASWVSAPPSRTALFVCPFETDGRSKDECEVNELKQRGFFLFWSRNFKHRAKYVGSANLVGIFILNIITLGPFY